MDQRFNISAAYRLKTKTLNGDLCRIHTIMSDEEDGLILFKKLVLSKEDCSDLGCIAIKKFKDYTLWLQIISFRRETFMVLAKDIVKHFNRC